MSFSNSFLILKTSSANHIFPPFTWPRIDFTLGNRVSATSLLLLKVSTFLLRRSKSAFSSFKCSSKSSLLSKTIQIFPLRIVLFFIDRSILYFLAIEQNYLKMQNSRWTSLISWRRSMCSPNFPRTSRPTSLPPNGPTAGTHFRYIGEIFQTVFMGTSLNIKIFLFNLLKASYLKKAIIFRESIPNGFRGLLFNIWGKIAFVFQDWTFF